MELKPLLGLLGVLIAALTVEFNDGVSTAALIDVRGGLGISHDPGTWLTSLYSTGQVIGFSIATWCALTVSIRHWLLFVIALCCAVTLCIPFTSNLGLLYALRFVQGLASGFTIPLLLTVALQVLSPATRLYGLAAYGLTATFGPNISEALAALWTDVLTWQFVFLEDLPLCTLSGLLVWYGVKQQAPQYERVRQFDWRGFLLVVVGFGAFTTMLAQGDRLDWFNSPAICVMALLSAVALPLLVANELVVPVPLYQFALLKRRNLAWGLTALFSYLLISQSGSTLPITFLTQVGSYRPTQVYIITLLIAVPQFLLLPLVAVLLDIEWLDSRFIAFFGLLCIIAACLGASFITSIWQSGDFLAWQCLQAIGGPFFVMSLLMVSTNAIGKPEEGPFASTLVNSMRGLAEPVSAWLIQLIMRWRGGLHYNRIVDQSGQGSFSTFGPGFTGQGAGADGTAGFSILVEQQANVLTFSDAYLVLGAIAVALMAVLLVLPVRTYPPRIVLAKH